MAKRLYESPRLEAVGSFEELTKGGLIGSSFDGTFVIGQPVPLDPSGHPLLFS